MTAAADQGPSTDDTRGGPATGPGRCRQGGHRTIKVVGAAMVHNAIDRAIQVWGGAGVTEDLPLEAMYRQARWARLVDGATKYTRSRWPDCSWLLSWRANEAGRPGMSRFEGRVAVVTGFHRGYRLAIAERLAAKALAWPSTPASGTRWKPRPSSRGPGARGHRGNREYLTKRWSGDTGTGRGRCMGHG